MKSLYLSAYFIMSLATHPDQRQNPIEFVDDIQSAFKEVLARMEFSNVFIVADENTRKHCLSRLGELPQHTKLIIVGAGELNKNLHTCLVVWKQLLQIGADRHSVIVNLGGGMVTDLGSFAASTYMRGIRFINIPTSLLGMVDASIGGKTGVDLDHFKNMIGSFSFPDVVIMCPVFLNTLPDKEWRNGMAEMLKHGLIGDEELWNRLSEVLSHKDLGLTNELKTLVAYLIPQAVQVKMKLVEMDVNELNERKFLNFGHTVGHAIETWSLKHDDHPLSHGNAVAMGIICESFISQKLCGFNESDLGNVVAAINNLFSHVPIPKVAMQEITHIMRSDKKSKYGTISMALLTGIGTPVLQDGVSAELIHESLNFYNSVSGK